MELKRFIPLGFLLFVSLFWAWFYQTDSWWNDYGQAKSEMLFFIEVFCTLPILCFFLVKDKKEALLKSLLLVSLGVFIGSFIIPESNKYLWSYLENGRYLVLAVFFLLEVVAVATVVLAIRVALKGAVDPDVAITQSVEKYAGNGLLASVVCFEVRMWSWLFFANKMSQNTFRGYQHFTYSNKDGAKSNAFGFIFMVAFGEPLNHFLLHFIWSPMAANVITILTLFTLAFFIAEYRAMDKRPVSLSGDRLFIRMGIYQPYEVELSNIQSICSHSEVVRRQKNIKRYNYAGNPNVCIRLKQPVDGIDTVYLGVDLPHQLIDSVKQQLAEVGDRPDSR